MGGIRDGVVWNGPEWNGGEGGERERERGGDGCRDVQCRASERTKGRAGGKKGEKWIGCDQSTCGTGQRGVRKYQGPVFTLAEGFHCSSTSLYSHTVRYSVLEEERFGFKEYGCILWRCQSEDSI